jgi:hypothetical protein
MRKSQRAIAVFFIAFVILGGAMPIAFNKNPATNIVIIDAPYTLSSTNYVVTVRVLNLLQAFNDDDFEFKVLNGTVPLSNAWVRLFNATDKSLYDATHFTDGNGITIFSNLPVGTYQWNVSHAADTHTPDKTGQIVSNGPEATVKIQFGNLDWQNNNDDLNATIKDIENNPANNLNFSLHFLSNGSIYAQTEVVDGNAYFENIPNGNYIWRLTVLYDPVYAGYLLDSGTVQANGTQMLVYQELGPLVGVPDLYDLELFTYYETSLQPLPGAVINLMFKNGTLIDTKTTPANGTVIFSDLPIAFINWTVTYGGQPLGLGNYSYDLTSVASDIRKPVIVGPGDQSMLYTSENYTISWHIEDEHPSVIKVYVDGKLNITQSWVNSTYEYVYNVSASFPNITIGNYEIKIVAYDQNHNFAENTVKLRIYENVTPVIEGPDPLEFYFTVTGKSLTWNVSDAFLNMYRITDNNSEFAAGNIDPEDPVITISLDGLSIGLHNFTLYANDTSGNTATYSVLVTVLRDLTPPTILYAPPDIVYAQGDTVPVRNWTATDDFKDYYTISVDDEVVVHLPWTTDSIEFDFSGLLEGMHSVTLRVYDLGGNFAESQVSVVVTQSTVSKYLIFSGLIALGAIVLVLAIWFVRYR